MDRGARRTAAPRIGDADPEQPPSAGGGPSAPALNGGGRPGPLQLEGVQTPQVFEIGLLKRAYAQADLSSTDDASLIEKLGETVHVVDGDPRNVKITRPIDLHLIRLILQLKESGGRPVHKRF
jgi:2-C-methyl-D-erythritol 4-phosphate cytidylyltransferase